MSESCKCESPGWQPTGCNEKLAHRVYSFQEGTCFEDDIYFGKVVFADETIIQVQVDKVGVEVI